MQKQSISNWQALLGLDWREAQRRLLDAGADVCVSRLYGKKGPVAGADAERVIRIRAAGTTVEVLLSSFCSDPEV